MTKTSPPEGYLFSKAYTAYVFLLLWLLYFFDYVDRMVVVSLFPFLKADWGLTDAQCGAMVSAVYWAIILFSFPISIVIDRWSRKKSIGIMAVLWSLATAACALTKNFGQLFAARTAIGIGEAGYAPGGTAMISALYPEKRRAFMVGIWNASIPIGMAAGIVIGGLIASHWGWRHAFGIVALPGLVIALLFFFIKDYKTVGLEKTVDLTAGREGIRSGHEKDEQDGHRPRFCRNAFTSYDLLRVRRNDVHFHIDVHLPAHLLPEGPGLSPAEGHPPGERDHADQHHRFAPGGVDCGHLDEKKDSGPFAGPLYLRSPDRGPVSRRVSLTLRRNGPVWDFPSGGDRVHRLGLLRHSGHPGCRPSGIARRFLRPLRDHPEPAGERPGPVVTGAFSDRYGILAALKIASAMALISCVLFYIGSRYYKRDLDKVERVALTPES